VGLSYAYPATGRVNPANPEKSCNPVHLTTEETNPEKSCNPVYPNTEETNPVHPAILSKNSDLSPVPKRVTWT
jgi:hypothetical protein